MKTQSKAVGCVNRPAAANLCWRGALQAMLAAALVSSLQAEEAKKIQDNSFLLEEAYNQEPGVVQHIQSFQYLRQQGTWGYSFTEEWPAPGQAHQVSVTVPMSRISGSVGVAGLGDILLNYRYQLAFRAPVALAPRLSLLLPTGDWRSGLGGGSAGAQMNIPFSVDVSDRWVMHWNAGATFVPGSRGPAGARADTLGFNYGVGAIFSVAPSFNIMCEAVWNSYESVGSGGVKTRGEAFFISPGMRFALNFKSGLQVVPGLAFPVKLGSSQSEYGLLTYLSLEHPLF